MSLFSVFVFESIHHQSENEKYCKMMTTGARILLLPSYSLLKSSLHMLAMISEGLIRRVDEYLPFPQKNFVPCSLPSIHLLHCLCKILPSGLGYSNSVNTRIEIEREERKTYTTEEDSCFRRWMLVRYRLEDSVPVRSSILRHLSLVGNEGKRGRKKRTCVGARRFVTASRSPPTLQSVRQ